MIELSASILGANIMQLGQEIDLAVKAGVKRLHLDIMDGNYVDNISFGCDLIPLIKARNSLPIDVHLMTEKTDKIASKCLCCMPNTITFHPATAKNPTNLISQIKAQKVKAGIAINPEDDVNDFLELFKLVDEVILMTVVPGACGQAFMPETLNKIEPIRKHFAGTLTIDGGVKPETIKTLKKYQINVAVSGSGIFSGDLEKNLEEFASNN